MIKHPASTSRLLKPWQCNKHFHFNCIKMMTQFKSSHFHHLGWKHWLIMLSVKSAVLARKQIALSNGAFSQLALCKQSWPTSKLAWKLIKLNQMRLSSQTRKKRWCLSWGICKKVTEKKKSCIFLFLALFSFWFFFFSPQISNTTICLILLPQGKGICTKVQTWLVWIWFFDGNVQIQI